MKQQVLGLDINDEYIAAVVMSSRGQEKVISASSFMRRDNPEDLSGDLAGMIAELGWKEGTCVCGLPFSGVSLRNLSLPFSEKRKIDQILPLELEDQLLRPVSDQVIEYLITRVEEDASHLFIAGIDKERLANELERLHDAGLSPEIVTLRTITLVEEYLRVVPQPGNFLFLDSGLYEMNMVIVRDGRIAFARRLVCPDRVFTARPFAFGEAGLDVVDQENGLDCVATLCREVRQTLGLFQLENGLDSFPMQVVMFGTMAGVTELRDKISSELDQQVLRADFAAEAQVSWTLGAGKGKIDGVFDHAASLALQGLRKRTSLNFLKEEFAPPKMIATPRQMVAASIFLALLLVGTLAYLGVDYRKLDTRYSELGSRMNGLFRETFPESTRIVDPLIQMQTKVRDVQAPSMGIPVFSGEKRVLNILADISGRIPGEVEIHVSRMVIDRESVVIKGSTDTFNNVNLIQGVLRKSPYYTDVAIVSAAAEKDSAMIRFELKLKSAGAS